MSWKGKRAVDVWVKKEYLFAHCIEADYTCFDFVDCNFKYKEEEMEINPLGIGISHRIEKPMCWSTDKNEQIKQKRSD